MDRIKSFIKEAGWPRIIIGLFLVSLFLAAPFVGVGLFMSFGDVFLRFGMNAILVLSMVPMIQSGCGLNFGLPVALIAGMLGSVISIELQLTGLVGFFAAVIIASFFAILFGFVYGQILNRVKGDEMIIATYVGFSMVALMNMMWLVLPFKNPASVQGFKGEGLRTTIALDNYFRHALFGPKVTPDTPIWLKALKFFGEIQIPNPLGGAPLIIPTGMILFFALMAFLVWIFFKTKLGTAITAVGSNPDYARAAGINIDKMRLVSVILSSIIAAIGMVVYQQGFGFVQMFNAPLAFAFPSVAAVLLGGASVNKASITNVIVGTFLFQGILTMTPSIINSAIQIDVSEIIRIIVSNGMIVYALTRKGGKK